MRHGVLRETYAYDLGDRLIEKRDGEGNLLLSFEVGDNGLHSKRILASGEVHNYEYDDRGNFTNASTDKASIALDYDLFGSVVLDQRDGRGIRRYAKEERIVTEYLDRFAVSYHITSDSAALIETPVGGIHRFQRRDDGTVLKELGSGTNELIQYDTDGKCTDRIVWHNDHTDDAWWVQYQYSPAGELRRIVDSARNITEFEYDAAHRLICERPQRGFELRIVYDAAGNLISLPTHHWMRYIEGKRLVSAAQKSFYYNTRNHLAEEVTESGLRTRFHYNSLDMLVKMSWSDRPQEWTAEYDGLGRRIHKALGDSCTDFYWDGDRLAAEMVPDGKVRLYIYPTEEALVPFMFIDYKSIDAELDSGQSYYIFHNQVGLPLRIEDVRGKTVWRADHIEPYGEITVASGNRITYNLRFPGHYFDEETGLHYNRFRYYSPTLGRYLQSDPAGQSGGINLYVYPSNPIVEVDVLGLMCDKSDSNSPEGDGDTASGHNREDVQQGLFEEVQPARRLTDDELRKAADAIHGELDPISGTQRTTTVTQGMEGDKVVHAVTNSNGTLGPAQRQRARAELGENTRFPPTSEGNTSTNQHHSEQRGIRQTRGQTDRVQASSSRADHGGAACGHCHDAQQQAGVRNATGSQPPNGTGRTTPPPW